MPTPRNPHERMDLWKSKDDGTLYMTTTDQAQQGTAPMWSDGAISRAGDKAADEYNAPPGEVEVSELVVKYLTAMRNQYEAEIATLTAENERLRAELAERATWEPVPNGYNTGRIGRYEIQIGLETGRLIVYNVVKNREAWALDLPDDLKLFVRGRHRRTSSSAGSGGRSSE